MWQTEAFAVKLVLFICAVARMTSSSAGVTSSPNEGVTCDMEAGWCGWRAVSTTDYTFHRHHGPTPDRSSGPQTDHTLQGRGQGHYIYSSGWDSQNTQETASLFSGNLTLPHPTTFSVWYQMNGNGVGSLSLFAYQLHRGHRSGAMLLWTLRGRQGLEWKQKQILLRSGYWQLEFRTRVKHPYGSDIALDDIRLGRMPEDSTTSSTSTATPPYTTSRTPHPTSVSSVAASNQTTVVLQTTASRPVSSNPLTWTPSSTIQKPKDVTSTQKSDTISSSTENPKDFTTTEKPKDTDSTTQKAKDFTTDKSKSRADSSSASQEISAASKNAAIGVCVSVMALAAVLAMVYAYKRGLIRIHSLNITQQAKGGMESAQTSSPPADTVPPNTV